MLSSGALGAALRLRDELARQRPAVMRLHPRIPRGEGKVLFFGGNGTSSLAMLGTGSAPFGRRPFPRRTRDRLPYGEGLFAEGRD